MNSKDLIKLLRENGWKEVNCEGSHHQFKKVGYQYKLTVPHPKKDLGKGLTLSILKKAGLK